MATFIILGSYTAQGIATIKDSPTGSTPHARAWAQYGVTIKDFYLTMGEHDIVAVVDAPDTAAAAKGVVDPGDGGEREHRHHGRSDRRRVPPGGIRADLEPGAGQPCFTITCLVMV